MIKIDSASKIFVHCPAGMVTGGAELLHQLVHSLNNKGHEAYIVYYGDKKHTIPSDYECYNIKVADAVEDIQRNVEVIFEGRFDLAFLSVNTQKVLWWLSVDNFFGCSIPFLSPLDGYKFNKKIGVKSLLHRIKSGGNNIKFSLNTLKNLDAVHAYQSEYAQFFLQSNGFGETVALKDFINTDHYNKSRFSDRENIILYNPKKGFSFTKKLISITPDLNWVPLVGMSRSELIKVMRKAKLYIDFGHHPGKDRLPRECALNGCCVITGKRGSAAFFEDVMLPNKYKFDEKSVQLKSIIDRIKWVLDNYEEASQDMDMYIRMILSEYDDFEHQVENLFGTRSV